MLLTNLPVKDAENAFLVFMLHSTVFIGLHSPYSIGLVFSVWNPYRREQCDERDGCRTYRPFKRAPPRWVVLYVAYVSKNIGVGSGGQRRCLANPQQRFKLFLRRPTIR